MTARRDWTDVRGLIEKQTGPVLAAQSVTEGLNSEIAVVVRTSLGATFVKGLRCDHRRAWTQQQEAEINPYVVPLAPRLRWHVEEDGWNLLGFEYVTGHHVDYSPGSPDLPKVVHALRLLGQIPCPDLPLKVAQQRWSSYTDAAQRFAGDHLLHGRRGPVLGGAPQRPSDPQPKGLLVMSAEASWCRCCSWPSVRGCMGLLTGGVGFPRPRVVARRTQRRRSRRSWRA
ncbi:MAG: hypothetical protein JO115_06555 [Pseudonocardiales bacterium]|nr:hypothetical protein [Pseudonocardiales bacterium]